MTELIKTLTDFLKEATLYLSRQNHPVVGVQDIYTIAAPAASQPELPLSTPVNQPTAAAVDAAPRKPGRPRKYPLPVAAPPADTPVAAPDLSVGEMREDESRQEARTAAKAYVSRFATSAEGVAAYRQLLKETCNREKLEELDHEQRLAFIAVIRTRFTDAQEQRADVGV